MEPWADPDFVLDEMRDNGISVRQPTAGDALHDRGDRLTVLGFDAVTGLIRFEDADGFALHRARSTVWWDGEAWRCWGAG